MPQYTNTAMDNGYVNNKDVVIKRVNSIILDSFRTFKNKEIKLGENITIISGKNGTMKTTILGLLAHPFSSKNNARDLFGIPLKTDMQDVFRLSLEKDNEIYWYQLDMTCINNKSFCDPIRVFPYEPESRHRVVVGETNIAGKGTFHLNTSYINLKRLYPIIETKASQRIELAKTNPEFDEFIHDAYQFILGRDSFKDSVPVSQVKSKNKFTVGPINSSYDYNSMSSGEDNLGHILMKMYAIQTNKFNDNPDQLNGIFCIDEIEAGFHPVAQARLFDYLFAWSKKNNIHVVATTHSLYLIQHALDFMNRDPNKMRRVKVNILSTAFVKDNNYEIIENPSYSQAYKELTYKNIENLEDSYKITVLCEDDTAKLYATRLIKDKKINSRLDFIHGITIQDGNSGTGYKSLMNLVKNGEKLFLDSLILFDPEVSKACLISEKVQMKILPSLHQMPIEKEIIKFIYDCPNDHIVFSKLNKEKMAFLDEFIQCGIRNLDDLVEMKKNKTDLFKNWAKSHKQEFNKLITMYIHENYEALNPYRTEIIHSLNLILQSKSLPTFEN